ncbi:hypothetical protein C8R46DRAFT_905567 [Mycena filopes]|nr:hypothetical protein C8R46DRAFT_905567 [Mycena filopes]
MVGSRPASAPPLTTPSIDILREPRPPVTQLLSALSYGTPSGNGPPSGPALPLSFEQPPLSHHSPSQVLPPRTPSLGNISLPQSQPFVDLKDWPALHWHAPHAILAQGSMYPSAMHLHASKRYYPQNLPFAELIRLCPDVNDVHALSERLALESPTSVRSDWDTSFMTSMEDVLLLMFTQHPDLCAMLLWTGDMPIAFSSEQDLFWGQNGPGGPGLNHYGHLLEQVRERLRDPTRRRKVHFVETGAQEGE